jgi:hypothetical protein
VDWSNAPWNGSQLEEKEYYWSGAANSALLAGGFIQLLAIYDMGKAMVWGLQHGLFIGGAVGEGDAQKALLLPCILELCFGW